MLESPKAVGTSYHSPGLLTTLHITRMKITEAELNINTGLEPRLQQQTLNHVNSKIRQNRNGWLLQCHNILSEGTTGIIKRNAYQPLITHAKATNSFWTHIHTVITIMHFFFWTLHIQELHSCAGMAEGRTGRGPPESARDQQRCTYQSRVPGVPPTLGPHKVQWLQRDDIFIVRTRTTSSSPYI